MTKEANSKKKKIYIYIYIHTHTCVYTFDYMKRCFFTEILEKKKKLLNHMK